MPPNPFRVVRLGAKRSRTTATASGVSLASQRKMTLLTYKMALAQPQATVPLLANALKQSTRTLPALTGTEGSQSEQGHALDVNRRWVRDADELCIASIRRSNNINKINTYVATYKFDDPHWRPFLLPEVHVVPVTAPSSARPPRDTSIGEGGGSSPPTGAASPAAYNVFIDYNKQINVELISRHANFALRHLVQKGHAMYFVNYSQHSILEMRGLIETSYITCAYGIKGERLRTHLLHIGPLDVRDVIEMDPVTGRVTFNLKKPAVRRGVVAVSLVEGYGTWFQRKPMLWQRTRRIGALQSQMGAFDYQLCPSETVGKVHDYEVALLEPHLRLMGAGGGAEAVGIIASSQVAQNDRLYVGQFEAPVIAALDAVHQLMHRVALHNRLARRASTAADDRDALPMESESEEESLRVRLRMERMLPVAWVTRTPPPYVPLEADLPFRLQLSKPAVFHTETVTGADSDVAVPPVVFPTGGTVGSPMVKGVPLSLFEYNVHQGVDHYLFDDAPSARPTKWWSQKSNMPYNGYLYCMRSGLLDYVVPAETFTNPLAPPSPAAHRRSSSSSQRWKRERRRQRHAAKKKSATATAAPEKEKGTTQRAEEEADLTAPLAEHWQTGQSDLTGHDEASLSAENALLHQEEQERYTAQKRPPLADIVPPSEKAAERAARYERNLLDEKGQQEKKKGGHAAAAAAEGRGGAQSGSKHASADPTVAVSAAEALLQRRLRQRALKKKLKLKKERGAPGPSTNGAEKG